MTFKKLLSGCLCTAMLFGTFTATTYAEETPTENAWNYSEVDESVTDLYADFPVQIDKNVHKDMSLDIHFRYLKNLSSQNEASLEIKDLSDNSVKASFDFSAEEISFVLENAENNKTFSVEITENINGVTNFYTGYISTKYVPTDFPVNMTIGNTEYLGNSGETFEQIALKKVGVNPVCNHGEDEECTDECSIASVLTIVKPDELDTFYSELDSDSFYEIQVMANNNGHTDVSRGFISTYANSEELGVFTPGYEFSLHSNYGISTASDGIATASVSSYPGISWDDVEADFEDNGTIEYYSYENILYTSLSQSNDVIIEWITPETGYYTVETIGNLDTEIYEFTVTDDVPESIGDVISDGGIGENASNTFGAMEGVVKYFFVNRESGSSGAWAFRIKRNDYSNKDSISGYRDEVQAAYDNGIFSSATNENCDVWYNGDVNIFAYNVRAGVANLIFNNTDIPLKARVYSVSGRSSGLDQLWLEDTFTGIKKSTATQIFECDLSSGVHYVDVFQKQNGLPRYDDVTVDTPVAQYDFRFYDAKQRDAEDEAIYQENSYSESPGFPTEITTFPYSINSRTLHKGDSDWFTFVTGPEGGDFSAKLYEIEEKSYQYNIYLYEIIEFYEENDEIIYTEWYTPENIGDIETMAATTNSRGYQELTYSNLLPNHKYYIEIDRNSSSQYSSAYTYDLEAYLTISNDVVEANIVPTIEHINNYDWLHCAKELADFRLAREGLSSSTLTEDDVADLLGFDPDNPVRGTLYQTYKATCLFYTNGTSTNDNGFTRGTNINAATENDLYEMISNGSIVIMQIGDSTATTDVTKMRYLIITGVNKTTHQLKVYDCLNEANNLVNWVDTSDIFDGGYVSSNTNVKFLGYIIEISND